MYVRYYMVINHLLRTMIQTHLCTVYVTKVGRIITSVMSYSIGNETWLQQDDDVSLNGRLRQVILIIIFLELC